ncbi:MAG TPA: hypothetical protein VK679_17400 [Gemmatimonadaceae bacterium]|nr:hypothetical protein [Gemmatimonadaceae bacterium]
MRRVLLATFLIAGCAGRYGYGTTDPARQWPATRVAAESLITTGRYAAADSLLGTFSTRYSGTAEGAESLYWRAVLDLDPSNLSASPKDALTALDAYDAAPHNDAHLTEAHILRRVAVLVGSIQRLAEQAASQSDSASAADSATRASRAAAASDRVRSKDEEIARLRTELESTRAELDRTKEELDRIKKRLATPPRAESTATPP